MLATATVRTQWPAFVGTFLALSLGVALIATTLLVLVGAQPRVPHRYAAAPVVVASAMADGRPWAGETADLLARRLGELESVELAIPDRSYYAQLIVAGRATGDPTEDREGHAWSMAQLAGDPLVAGRGPQRDGEVALAASAGPGVGDRVSVLTGAGRLEATVTGLVAGPGIYVADASAARLAGGVRVIGLVTRPGTNPGAVGTAAQSIVGGDGRALTGSRRSELESPRDQRIRADAGSILATMTSVAVFVAVFVVASTFAFGVAQRRREFGLLRAVGATPGQIRRTVYAEALMVGFLASATGAALGAVLIHPFTGLLVRARLLPPGPSVSVPVWVLAVAASVGVFVALAGVWSASRRAGKVRPLEALREAAVEKRTMTVGR